jgi:hypothetical protein
MKKAEFWLLLLLDKVSFIIRFHWAFFYESGLWAFSYLLFLKHSLQRHSHLPAFA